MSHISVDAGAPRDKTIKRQSLGVDHDQPLGLQTKGGDAVSKSTGGALASLTWPVLHAARGLADSGGWNTSARCPRSKAYPTMDWIGVFST